MTFVKFTSKDVNQVCWHHFCKFLLDANERDANNTPLFICRLNKEFGLSLPIGLKRCPNKRTNIKSSMVLVIKLRKQK